MKPSYTKYVVPAHAKQRLEELLQKADPNCIIGIGIRIHLQGAKNPVLLFSELQSLAAENPAYMQKIIGHEAMQILCPDLAKQP